MAKRTIEVFTGGCPLCAETLRLVRDSVSACGCEVIERPCASEQRCVEAVRYGVRTTPTVVVNGEIMFEGQITPAQAALLTQQTA
jgi:glutaredoxin